MELVCGMYGEAAVFPVKGPRDARVFELQAAIFTRKRYDRRRVDFDESNLVVYLARKGGVWMADNPDNRTLLRGDVDPQFLEMNPTWELSDPAYFDKDFEPPKRVIHVLVRVAAAICAQEESKSERTKDANDSSTKRKRYCHSRMNSKNGEQLLHDLKIRVEVSPTDPFKAGRDDSIQPFHWGRVEMQESNSEGKLSQQQHRDLYRAYVEQNIGDVLTEKELCVFGVERNDDVLSVAIDGFNIELAGRTDLLVLSNAVEHNPLDVCFLPGARILIEVKREVSEGSIYETLSELVALDLLAKDSVMALLTNLTDNWQFFWVSTMEKSNITVYKATIDTPEQAFAAIRAILSETPRSESDIRLPFIREPAERGETSGVRDVFEQYFDVASVFGPDASMARAIARQTVNTISSFSFSS